MNVDNQGRRYLRDGTPAYAALPAIRAPARNPDAYAVSDAICGAVKMGLTQSAAAQLCRFVVSRHGILPTGELLGKILFYRAHPPE